MKKLLVIFVILFTAFLILFFLSSCCKKNEEKKENLPYIILEDDPKVDSKINPYILGNDLIIEYSSDAKPKIEGLSSDRYKIEERRIIVYNYTNEHFKLAFGANPDVYEFGAKPFAPPIVEPYPKEIINHETNEKILTIGNITIKSPYEIVCVWSNASSLWKDCSVVIEVNNSDTKNDLRLKGDGLSVKFLKDVRDLKVYTSYSYTLYNDTILNKTCFDNLTSEEKEISLENKTLCHYNYTRKSFYDFTPVTKLDRIKKNSVIGIKLEFKSPIEAEAGVYLKNQFNFTLLSDYNITLDPDISGCSVLSQAGATYNLTADIYESTLPVCMDITANNITLNCLGRLIDSFRIEWDNCGIRISRTSATNTNITIRNCRVQHWARGILLSRSNNNTIINSIFNNNSYGIFLSSSANNTIINSTANNNTNYGIYLYSSANNTIINSTANSNNFGIYLEHSSNNRIINSTANNNSYYGYGIWIYYSSNNTIINSTANNNTNYGIYLEQSSNNQIINSTLTETLNYDFHIVATDDAHCNNYLENVMGSNRLPIRYFNSSVTLSNVRLSQLILCNADYSNITNVTIDASPTLRNNLLYVLRTDHSNFTLINSSNNREGIYLEHSLNNRIINSIANNNIYGIFLRGSSNNTIINSTANNNSLGVFLHGSSNNTIINSTANSNSDGIELWESSNNQIINSSANNNTFGIYLSGSSNNQIINSTANNNARGIYLWASSDNTFTGGSVALSTISDYCLGSAGATNNFTATNFTASRRIYFTDATSWFNYRNESDGIWLRTNVSAGFITLNRTLNRWSQINMSWNDATTSGNATARYNLTGLLPNREYHVYNFSVLTYTLMTDSTGSLSFDIFLNNTTRTIEVFTDTPPHYSLNSTNSTTAGTAVMHSLRWTDPLGLSGFVFSFDNCTGTLVNDTWVPMTGTGNWSNVTKVINSTVGCTIRWRVYANDTSNNWNASFIYSYVTMPPGIYLTGCSVLGQAGATYYLTANIINSGSTHCMNITANNITLDCQNYLIDGVGTSGTRGINILRASATNTNITIRNCRVQDWGDGIYLHNANNNTIINSIFNNNSYGVFLSSSANNTFTGGSVALSTISDYYLAGAGATNNFTATNFTASRRIWFNDTTSWFNYRNESDGIWLRTNVSAARNLTRTLNRWSLLNMSWNDSLVTGTAIARYNLTGLLPNREYQVYNFSVLAYTLTTDSTGSLSFTIFLNTTTRTIEVNTSCSPPATGEWVIPSGVDCICNATWIAPANLHLYGSLTMQSACNIRFTSSGQNIYVYPGGTIFMHPGSGFNKP